MNLDRTDIEILKLLRENSRMSLKAISDTVALSQPSVKTRIERLVDSQYIKGFTVDLDYKKLGFNMAFIIRITDISVHFSELLTFLKTKNELTEVFSVTGSDNYLIKGFVRTTEEIEELLSELMAYGKINTSIILESHLNSNFLDLLTD